jgi:hypothetical protein
MKNTTIIEIDNTCVICSTRLESSNNVSNSNKKIIKYDSEYCFGCSCNVNFHEKCITQWAESKLFCPYCFSPFEETLISKSKRFIKHSRNYMAYQFILVIIYFCLTVYILVYPLYLIVTIK